MRARGPQLIGAAVLFAGAITGCDSESDPTTTSIAGTACDAAEEGAERCSSDLNIYRCADGVLVFVRSATVTTGCPVIGYVGITRGVQARHAGRRLRAQLPAAQV